MDRKFFWMNMVMTLADMIVSLASIAVFTFVAFHFDKWWVILFGLLPTIMFYNRGVILDTVVDKVEEEKNE